MTRKELVKAIMDNTDKPYRVRAGEIDKVVKITLETIAGALAAGEDVKLGGGFGSFRVEQRAERQGHNPKTGKSLTIPACNVVKFKPGTTLRETVNG